MIEINLLPPELKLKPKPAGFGAGAFKNLPVTNLLYLVPLALAGLICAHIFLGAMSLAKSFQLKALESKWRNFEPQRKILEDFTKEYQVLSGDEKTVQQLIGQRINWSEKLNKLSLDLPSGVWFNELSLTGRDFVLRVSAVSLEKEEMGLVNKFIDNLKNDPDFFKDFKSLELSSVQRRSVGGYDIVDFVLSGALK